MSTTSLFIKIGAADIGAQALVGRLRGGIRGLAKDAEKADRDLSRTMGHFRGGAYIMAGGVALVSKIKPGVQAAANLQEVLKDAEAEMANLDAATRKINLAKLEAEAQRVQAFTDFSARGVAEIELTMVKSGLSPSKIVDKASAEAAAALATLNRNLSAEAAAPMVVQLGAQFDLPDYRRVVQALEAGKSVSPLDPAEIQAGLENMGPVVREARMDIETAVAALAALKTLNVGGSEAGTAIKMFYANLMDPSRRKYLKAMGVNIYDAQGKLKDFYQITSEIQTGLGKFDPQRQHALQIKLFDKDQWSRISNLYAKGDNSVANMEARIRKAPSYLDKLAVRMEGLNVKTKAAGGNWETTFGQIFKPLLGDLTKAVNLVDTLGTKTRQFFQEHQALNQMAAYMIPALAGGLMVTGATRMILGGKAGLSLAKNLKAGGKGGLTSLLFGRAKGMTVELAQAKALEAVGIEAQKVIVLNWPAGLEGGVIPAKGTPNTAENLAGNKAANAVVGGGLTGLMLKGGYITLGTFPIWGGPAIGLAIRRMFPEFAARGDLRAEEQSLRNPAEESIQDRFEAAMVAAEAGAIPATVKAIQTGQVHWSQAGVNFSPGQVDYLRRMDEATAALKAAHQSIRQRRAVLDATAKLRATRQSMQDREAANSPTSRMERAAEKMERAADKLSNQEVTVKVRPDSRGGFISEQSILRAERRGLGR